MSSVVEVRFKGNRRDYFTWAGNGLAVNDPVIVEADRGQDLGWISALGTAAQQKCELSCAGCESGKDAPSPNRRVVRKASGEDERLADELRGVEQSVRQAVMKRATGHGLHMKISDAEWQWDRKKLTVYFTAERRVDFRSLVRDLAQQFRTRIELRQIGARDEAKRLDGVGRCGRQYCCSSWLTELQPVSLSLAKHQQLSLNPAQISGGCGRLLCCLRYEHEFYVSARKRFPKQGKRIKTAFGEELVTLVDIFRELVTLRNSDGVTRVVPLSELKRQVERAEPVADGASVESKKPDDSADTSAEQAERAVTPRRRRRPGGRGGRGGRR